MFVEKLGCLRCGAELRGQQTKFCSKVCNDYWTKRHLTADQKARGAKHRQERYAYQRSLNPLFCVECGDRITKAGHWKTCSTECHRGQQKRFTAAALAKSPERKRTKKHRYRARRRGLLEASAEHYTASEITVLLGRSRGRCAVCKKRRKLTVDHIIALANGGSNAITNIQLLCRPCNIRKHARDALEFNRSMGLLL